MMNEGMLRHAATRVVRRELQSDEMLARDDDSARCARALRGERER